MVNNTIDFLFVNDENDSKKLDVIFFDCEIKKLEFNSFVSETLNSVTLFHRGKIESIELDEHNGKDLALVCMEFENCIDRLEFTAKQMIVTSDKTSVIT